MKKIINVVSKSVAEELEAMGFSYIKQELNGEDIYSFVESDRLYSVLKDKKKFSKKDYFIDTKLRF